MLTVTYDRYDHGDDDDYDEMAIVKMLMTMTKMMTAMMIDNER